MALFLLLLAFPAASVYHLRCMADESTAPVPFEISQDALTKAIIELNSMSPCDGIIMTRSGEVKCGYEADEDCLCMLLPAGSLARRLTADGLASYSGKELKKWADAYDREALQAIADAARA